MAKLKIEYDITNNRSYSFDEEVVEYFIRLPSGRVLSLETHSTCEYDTHEETGEKARKHIEELESMLAELNSVIQENKT